MNIETIRNELTKPFTENEIKFRVGETGYKFNKPYILLLAYVDSRDIEDRLDNVLGFENWEDKYIPISYQDKKNISVSGYICELTINIDGKKVTKSNSAEMTNFEGLKGGCSKALVRTASRFGIGRHLYDFKNIYAEISDKKTDICKNYQKVEEKKWNNQSRKYDVVNTHNIYWGINSKKVIQEHLKNIGYSNNNKWSNIKVKSDKSKEIIKILFERYNKNYEKAIDFLKVFKIDTFEELDNNKSKIEQLLLLLNIEKDGYTK